MQTINLLITDHANMYALVLSHFLAPLKAGTVFLMLLTWCVYAEDVYMLLCTMTVSTCSVASEDRKVIVTLWYNDKSGHGSVIVVLSTHSSTEM